MSILIAILLLFTISNHIQHLREKPILNPQPKYFVTISGYISPKLKGKFNLTFEQISSTTADACFHEVSMLSGLMEAPNKIDLYRAQPNSKGYYVLKIPLDKYNSGYCHWIPWSLSYSYDKNFKPIDYSTPLINYGNITEKYNPKKYDLICDNKKLKCKIKLKNGTSMILFLKTKDSLTLNFNMLLNNGK